MQPSYGNLCGAKMPKYVKNLFLGILLVLTRVRVAEALGLSVGAVNGINVSFTLLEEFPSFLQRMRDDRVCLIDRIFHRPLQSMKPCNRRQLEHTLNLPDLRKRSPDPKGTCGRVGRLKVPWPS